jgi:hypothetical protein
MTRDKHNEEPEERPTDPLEEEQEGKGYGEDEGERGESLEEQNLERL